MEKATRPELIIIGGGGHARVLADVLDEMGSCDVIGFTDIASREVPGLDHLGGDDVLFAKHPKDAVRLVNGIGSVRRPTERQKVYEKFQSRGYRFCSVIHPRSIVSSRAHLGEGVQIMAGAVINAGAVLHEDVIVNTSASVDHDCVIGAHSHIAPGVILCGNVKIGRGCHIGTGAIIIQGVEIGDEVLIGAGETVKGNVENGVTVVSGVHDPKAVKA